MSGVMKPGPNLSIDPKLNAHFSNINFDLSRFTASLESMKVHDDVIETMQVVFKNTTPPFYQQDINYFFTGQKMSKGGEYLLHRNTIALYPRNINWILRQMKPQNIDASPWFGEGDHLSELHNKILAHEASHAQDLTSAHGLQGLLYRLDRVKTLKAYTSRAAIAGTFGGVGISELARFPTIQSGQVGFLGAGCMGFLGRDLYLSAKDRKEGTQPYDMEAVPAAFEHSDQAVKLFQGIISIAQK